MSSPAILAIKIISDSRDAAADLDATGGKFGKLKKFGKVAAAGLAVAGGAAAAFATDAVQSAADLQQSVGAVEAVFKSGAGQMKKFSAQAATSVGLSKNEYNELATVLGSQLKNGGVALDKLGGKTNDLIKVGADMSAMFGGTTKDAVEALSSALKGERDPIEKYGVTLKQATIDAEAAKLGYKKVGGSFSTTAQQAATLSLIMKQTKDAQGAFGRESDTLAHKQQVFAAKVENVKAKLGNLLLPIVTKVFGFLGDKAVPAIESVVKWLGKFDFSSLTSGAGAAGKFSGILDTLKTTALNVYNNGIKPLIEFVKTSLIPTVRSVAATILPPLVEGFRKVVPIVGDVLTAMLGLQKAIAERIMPVIRRLAPVVATVFRVVADVISKALKVVRAIIQTVTALIKGDWSGVWKGIQKIISTTWDLIKSIIKGALKIIKSVLSAAWDGIKSTMTSAWNKIRGAMSGAWDRVVSAVRTGIRNAVSAIGKLPGKAKRALGKLGSTLWQSGVDLVAGFIKGIWNKAKSIGSAIKNAVTDKIPGWIKGPLGIGSPSKVMADIAQWIPAGIAVGIADNARLVTRELDRVSRGITDTRLGAPTVDPFTVNARRAGARRPGRAGLAPTNVNVTFSGVVGDPQAVARQIRDLLDDSDALAGVTL